MKENIEIDESINTIEDIFKKWRGKVPLSRLVEEIDRDCELYKNCQTTCPGSPVRVVENREAYRFVDIVIQYHYNNGHYK